MNDLIYFDNVTSGYDVVENACRRVLFFALSPSPEAAREAHASYFLWGVI